MMKSAKARQAVCLALVALGLLVSGYLLFRTLSLLMSQDPNAFDVCSAVFGSGCDKTLLSASSWVLGIPLAGWGVVYYGALAGLFLLAWILGDAFESEALLTALLVSLAGVCGSVVLATILLAGWAPFCPLCMVVHGVNLLLAPALKLRTGRTWGQHAAMLGAALKTVFAKSGERRPEVRWKAVGMAAAALMVIAIYQCVFIVTQRWLYESKGVFNPHKLLSVFATTPEEDVSVDADDARRGPEDAPVEIIAFSSFHCPACQEFARAMGVLMRRYGDRVTLVYKHFPLAEACNPAAKGKGGSAACETAYAAVAAQRQGKFWEFHDSLYMRHFPPKKDTPRVIAEELGLEMARFEADRAALEVQEHVRANATQGALLGLHETPCIYINRRRMRGIGAQSIEVVIEDILKEDQGRDE